MFKNIYVDKHIYKEIQVLRTYHQRNQKCVTWSMSYLTELETTILSYSRSLK